MADSPPLGVDTGHDPVRRRVADLERYAGWLGRDALSARLRTSITGLARAVDNGDDPVSTLRLVQAHLNRLGPSGITPLLRQTMRNLRTDLAAGIVKHG